MDNTIISPLEDDGVYINSLIFETDWVAAMGAEELSMQLAYDYDVQIPREGAGPSDIRWMKHRNGMIGMNLDDLMHLHNPSEAEEEDNTYSPKVGMAIDLYVMYDWRASDYDGDEDEAPPAYARAHVRGQFSASRDGFSPDVTDEEITRWVGHMLLTSCTKRRRGPLKSASAIPI